MSIAFLHYIAIQREAELPVYLQITNGFIALIQTGILKPSVKLPGSREIARVLGVHRKTVIAALEELELQGWLEVYPRKGTFVSAEIPLTKPKAFVQQEKRNNAVATGFDFKINSGLFSPTLATERLQFNDGIPDVRLAPLHELANAYSSILKGKVDRNLLSYGDPTGSLPLRRACAVDLNNFRGMNITADNLLITRGSAMGIYLVAKALVQPGENVVVGETNYYMANSCFLEAGARLLKVKVDNEGLNLEEIGAMCKRKKIRAIYVTSHHHHPTTVTLSPERRVKLLKLAEKYRFAIIEDDYDYDYHFLNRPVLPLASADSEGLVIYIGSFSKKIAPAFRVGFVAAPRNLIDAISSYRRLVDRQGDPVLEQAIANLLEEGIIRRFTKKALRAYKARRDLFCDLLKHKLPNEVEFKIPDGGMAVWAKFNLSLSLIELSSKCSAQGLYLSNGMVYNPQGENINACRMGFASMNLGEIEEAVEILERVIKGRKR